MPHKMKKYVDDVIRSLKNISVPGKKTGSFWSFLKSQLAEEGEWDKKHIKVIEKEIKNSLVNTNKKTLTELWKETPNGTEKFSDDIKINIKEIKIDIIEEMIGQVMDRMDDNYITHDTFYSQADNSFFSSEKSKDNGDNEDEDEEPTDIPEIEEDDLMNDDFFDDSDEDDYKL